MASRRSARHVVTMIPLSTAACAAGTNQQVTFTASGNSVSAPPVTLVLQTAPAAATLLNPPPGATIPGGSTTFTWNAVSGATGYSLLIGSSPGASDIYNNGNLGTPTSVAATLPSIGTVYATLGTLVNGVWQSAQYTYNVNPSATGQSFSVTGGPAKVLVPNTGMEVQYTYHVTGGDATILTRVSTTLGGAGMSARIVGTRASTVTVGFAAPRGFAAQSMSFDSAAGQGKMINHARSSATRTQSPASAATAAPCSCHQ